MENLGPLNKRVKAYRWLKDSLGLDLEEVTWLTGGDADFLEQLETFGRTEPIDGSYQGQGPPVREGI